MADFIEVSSCMTAVRWHVWEMCPSATSTYSLRTSTWGFFTAQRCRIRLTCYKAPASSMRHVKLRPETATNGAALRRLIDNAYSDIKARVQNG
jgi:hypothetical protein